jgi:hypothetical protein
LSTKETEAASSDDETCGAARSIGSHSLRCALRPGHTVNDGWHESLVTRDEVITFADLRHVVHTEESITWAPVDRIKDAVRHLMADRADKGA